MTGVMKLVVPELRAAFSGQLSSSGIPFHEFNIWVVPVAEVVVGGMFVLGYHARIASLISVGMMVVATYVHLVVHDPTLFPLQPEAPIIPVVLIGLSLFILRSGSGSRSLDLSATL